MPLLYPIPKTAKDWQPQENSVQKQPRLLSSAQQKKNCHTPCQQTPSLPAMQLTSREGRDYLEPVHTSFVAFDLERTSRAKEEPPESDKIIEIGAVRVTDGQVTESFEQLVNPHRNIMACLQLDAGIFDSGPYPFPGFLH